MKALLSICIVLGKDWSLLAVLSPKDQETSS
jgi:hypothetical protein